MWPGFTACRDVLSSSNSCGGFLGAVAVGHGRRQFFTALSLSLGSAQPPGYIGHISFRFLSKNRMAAGKADSIFRRREAASPEFW